MNRLAFVTLVALATFTCHAAAQAVEAPPEETEPPPEEIAPAEAAQTAEPAEEVVPAPPAEPAVAEEPAEDDDDVTVEAAVGEGLTVRAGDLFSLQIRARIQFRLALGFPTDGAVLAGEDPGVHDEFMIRRMRLVFAGNALVPELRYYIQLGFAPLDMEADLLIPLRDAYITWQAHRDIGVRFGQMKVPFGLQRVISSSALQFCDRSTVTSELNLDRDIGLYLMSEDFLGLGGMLQYQVGVFGGFGRNRFGGLDKALFVARFLVRPLGEFDNMVEADIRRTPEPRFAIGVSGAYNIDSNRTRSTNGGVYEIARFDYAHGGADVHFKWQGFSFLAELLVRWTDQPLQTGTVMGMPVTEASRSAWGWFAQTGYVLPWLPLELGARYGEIHPFDVDPSANFFLSREVGGVVSYYFDQHNLKAQLDYFYYFGDDAGNENHQLRLQVQLYF